MSRKERFLHEYEGVRDASLLARDILLKVYTTYKEKEPTNDFEILHLLKTVEKASTWYKGKHTTIGDIPYKYAPPELGFPHDICVSVGDCVAHGVPMGAAVSDDTWVNIDVSIKLGGVYADVGESVNRSGKSCPAREVFYEVFKQLYVGMPIHHISALIEIEAKKLGLNPVRGVMSHGIGRKLHMKPYICNMITGDTGEVLQPYTFLALEPIVSEGTGDTYVDKEDGWSVRTVDGKQAWQYERTIAIHKDRLEILE